jgi:hypothetical protein
MGAGRPTSLMRSTSQMSTQSQGGFDGFAESTEEHSDDEEEDKDTDTSRRRRRR